MTALVKFHPDSCPLHPGADFDLIYYNSRACCDCIDEHYEHRQALIAGRDPALKSPCDCVACVHNMGRCHLCGAWTRRYPPLDGPAAPVGLAKPGPLCLFCVLLRTLELSAA